jgi:hypothetical protein
MVAGSDTQTEEITVKNVEEDCAPTPWDENGTKECEAMRPKEDEEVGPEDVLMPVFPGDWRQYVP